MLPLTWRHLFFLLPKQAQDNITNIQLLRREVLQNVSVIRPWGRCGWSSVSSGAEGLPGEVDRRLRFPALGWDYPGEGWAVSRRSRFMRSSSRIWVIWAMCGLINTCLHLARELPSVCIPLMLCRPSGSLLGSLPFPFFSSPIPVFSSSI